MGKFSQISNDAFDTIQTDAGTLLRTFNPAKPEIADEAIICTTTGGIQASCTPTFSDFGEDIDNVKGAFKEFKHLDNWECALAFTALDMSPEGIKLGLGCADVDIATGAIVPRTDLKQTDFSDLWWVGDLANGGCVAVQLKNALSTGGFSLQTTKNGKGQVSVTLTGHMSVDAQNEVPMKFYSKPPTEN